MISCCLGKLFEDFEAISFLRAQRTMSLQRKINPNDDMIWVLCCQHLVPHLRLHILQESGHCRRLSSALSIFCVSKLRKNPSFRWLLIFFPGSKNPKMVCVASSLLKMIPVIKMIKLKQFGNKTFMIVLWTKRFFIVSGILSKLTIKSTGQPKSVVQKLVLQSPEILAMLLARFEGQPEQAACLPGFTNNYTNRQKPLLLMILEAYRKTSDTCQAD